MRPFFNAHVTCLGPILIGAYLTWYSLPFLRTYLKSPVYSVFFLFLAFCGGFLCLKNKPGGLNFSQNKVIIPITIYMFVLCILSAIGVGNANNYIRISFAFCVMCFIEFSLDGSRYLKILLYYIVLLFFTTYCTSLYGLITSPMASRTLTASFADDKLQTYYALRNIGDIGFIQSILLFSPFCIYNIMTGKNAIKFFFLWCMLFVLALSASFTIALAIFLLFSSITVALYVKNTLLKVVLLFLPIVFFMIDYSWLFSVLSQVISNESISEKFNLLSDSSLWAKSDVGERMRRYLMSITTFIDNPIGVGPFYFVSDKNIGNHSAILDDLARFGLFAFFFFIWLIRSYYKDVVLKWAGFFDKKILIVFIGNYIAFLLLNPGFRFAFESIFVLLLVPHLPLLYNKKVN